MGGGWFFFIQFFFEPSAPPPSLGRRRQDRVGPGRRLARRARPAQRPPKGIQRVKRGGFSLSCVCVCAAPAALSFFFFVAVSCFPRASSDSLPNSDSSSFFYTPFCEPKEKKHVGCRRRSMTAPRRLFFFLLPAVASFDAPQPPSCFFGRWIAGSSFSCFSLSLSVFSLFGGWFLYFKKLTLRLPPPPSSLIFILQTHRHFYKHPDEKPKTTTVPAALHHQQRGRRRAGGGVNLETGGCVVVVFFSSPPPQKKVIGVRCLL